MNNNRRSHGYIIVDFNNVTENGLKELTQALNKYGAKVDAVEASNKKIKKDDVQVKRAKLSFDGGQTATIFAGVNGDVYQLIINGKKYPLPDVSNISKFAQYLANSISKGQAAFDKSAQKKAEKATKAINTSSIKPLSKSLKSRSLDAQNHLDNLTASKNELGEQYKTLRSTIDDISLQVKAKEDELSQERIETKKLKQQLAKIQVQN